MLNWNFLLDEAALASLLPNEYARFARPVREGLAVFLAGLPAARQAAIFQEQLALPLAAPLAERLGVLARNCPVLHKLGQVLARDRRLAPELRQRLRELESLPPTMPRESLHEMLQQELGPLDRLRVTLAPAPLAEASVAVVIPFCVEAPDSEPQEGVFKILKPGIEERLTHELDLLQRVGAHLDQRCEELGIPQLDYEEAFQQVREKLLFEVRLDREQLHLRQARAIYAHEPRVLVPAPMDFCTPRITAMERVVGVKVTDRPFAATSERRRLANLVMEALIAQPFFSSAQQALFHCDPHAGNLFVATDGRLAILDWSLVGCLGERERIAIVQILLAAATLRTDRILALLEDLAEQRPADRTALRLAVQAGVRQIRGGRLPGLSWLVGLLDDAAQTAGLRAGADLMLFRKSLHTLEGVVGDLGAGKRCLDEMLWCEFLRRFLVEWPWRWVAPPWSRAFATHLSNADLTHAALSFPCTVARFWGGHARDLLAGRRPAVRWG